VLSRTQAAGLGQIPAHTVARVVERVAGRLAAETRLEELLGGVIILRSGDFRERDFLPAESPVA
jgi:hypothetical protein